MPARILSQIQLLNIFFNITSTSKTFSTTNTPRPTILAKVLP